MADDWGSWLQSIMQNPGAGAPAGGPTAYGAGPGGVMPGGGVMNYPAATPGAPSMGYPAMARPAGMPQPQPSALSSSLTAQPGAPPWFQFGGFHPENILQHSGPSLGRLSMPDWGQPSGVSSPGDIINPTPAAGAPSATPAPIDPYGPARSAAPIDPYTLRGPSSPAGTSTASPATPRRAAAPAGPPMPPPRPAAAPTVNPAAIPGAPNLGYYRGATGNVRQAQYMPYLDPNDPRIYRGPLAS